MQTENKEMIMGFLKVIIVIYIITSLIFDKMCVFKSVPSIWVTLLVLSVCAATMLVDGILAALILIAYICMNIQCFSKQFFMKKLDQKIEAYQNMLTSIVIDSVSVRGEDVMVEELIMIVSEDEVPMSVLSEDMVYAEDGVCPISKNVPHFLENDESTESTLPNDYDNDVVDTYLYAPVDFKSDCEKVLNVDISTEQLDKIQNNIYDEQNYNTYIDETGNEKHFNIQGILT